MKMPMIRAARFAAVALPLFGIGSSWASAATAQDSIEVRTNLPALLQTLGSLPYSSEGIGPVIYVVEYSTCAYAQRFETEYGSKLAGMGFEVRRIYYGVDEATQDNAAAAALARDPSLQRAFMFEGRQASPIYDTPAALEAYQEVPDRLKAVVAVLQQNGWRSDRVVSPMFIYPDGKALFADGGYRRDHFEARILPRLRLASQGSTGTPAAARPAQARAQGKLPDILGFELGATSDYVLARAKTLKLRLPDQLTLDKVNGLPNSEHLAHLTAYDTGPQGVFFFRFSAPPEGNRVVSVQRGVDYEKYAAGAAPVASVMIEALTQKFGTPTQSSDISAYHSQLTWIWDREGRLLPKSLGTPCQMLAGRYMPTQGLGKGPPAGDHDRKLIDSGCALWMQANVTVDSAGVVQKLDHMAVDIAGGDRAGRATSQAVDDVSRGVAEKRRLEAGQRTPDI